MPRVRRPSTTTDVRTAPAKAKRPRKKAAADARFSNGKADTFKLKDPALAQLLTNLHADAAKLERVPQAVDRLVTIFGTARSKPTPGENGYADWVFAEKLGAALRDAGFSISTGAGPGAMEAPMVGHARRDAELDVIAGRTVGWEAGEPGREGANILLPHEQKATEHIPTDRLLTFDLFTYRMQFLFRDNVVPVDLLERLERGEAPVSPKLATPGGFGSIAEYFMYVAMRTHGSATEELLFPAHDDFFQQLNDAFTPFVTDEGERRDLDKIFIGNVDEVVQYIMSMPPATRRIDHDQVVPRMRDDLEAGLVKLDGRPNAVAFFSGEGPRSHSTTKLVEQIAAGAAKAGKPVRVSGSPVGDDAVIRGAQQADPDAEIQAFALHGSKVPDDGEVEYTRVRDPLVLRQLMNTNVDAIVTTPEGALQIAMLFTAATDMQTGKMEKKPIVVLDPDGKFEALKAQLEKSLLSQDRRYIGLADLDLFTVVKDDPKQALSVMGL